MENKPVSSTPLWPPLQFLPLVPALSSCLSFPGWWAVTCNLNKLLPPQAAFGCGVYQINREQTRTLTGPQNAQNYSVRAVSAQGL